MQIKIETDNGPKEIEMKSPKKKYTTELWKKLRAMQNAEKGKYIDEIDDFLKYRDKVAMKCSGLTEKEFEELTVEESEKLTSVVAEAAFGDLDFTRLFKQRQG